MISPTPGGPLTAWMVRKNSKQGTATVSILSHPDQWQSQLHVIHGLQHGVIHGLDLGPHLGGYLGDVDQTVKFYKGALFELGEVMWICNQSVRRNRDYFLG